jgi:hypothetical protein
LGQFKKNSDCGDNATELRYSLTQLNCNNCLPSKKL